MRGGSFCLKVDAARSAQFSSTKEIDHADQAVLYCIHLVAEELRAGRSPQRRRLPPEK